MYSPLLLYLVYSCAVLGKKRVAFRGTKRVEAVVKHMGTIFKQLSQLEASLGSAEYARRVKVMREQLKSTHSKKNTEDHKDAHHRLLTVAHQPSAKERESGVNVAPFIAGKLQYGKLFNKDNNVSLLRNEYSHRYLGSNPEDIPDFRTFGINLLKKWIRDDEVKRNPLNPEADNFFTPLFTEYKEYRFEIIAQKKT